MFWVPFLVSLLSFPTIFTNVFGFRLVGLTGGISTGKSTVTRTLKNLGIPVIDFDLIAREVVAPNSSCLNAIAAAFGSEILNPDGSLNRAKLGEMIFADPSKRKQLNAIMQRPIMLRFLWLLAQFFFLGFIPSKYKTSQSQPQKDEGPNSASHGINTQGLYPGLLQPFQGSRIVVLDCPLLFESGIGKLCSSTLFVDCDEDVQLSRLMARDNITKEQAVVKIKAQWAKDEKKKLATNIIQNNSTPAELYKNITTWWNKMTREEFGITLVKPRANFDLKMGPLLEAQRQIQLEYDVYNKLMETYKEQVFKLLKEQKEKNDKNDKKDKSSDLPKITPPAPPQQPQYSKSTTYPKVDVMVDNSTDPSFFERYHPATFCLKPTLLSSIVIGFLSVPSYFFIQYLERSWFTPSRK